MTIPLPNLASRIYLLKLDAEEGMVYRKFVVK